MSEIMLDNPASRDQMIKAMEAAGYHYDELESTPDNLRFFGEGGNVMSMAGWKECEDWLNRVVFDDPTVSDYVETILHPAQIPNGASTYIGSVPNTNPICALEDYLEQNDNNFDGVLNNMPEPTKTTPAADMADALAGSARDEEERFSILEELRKQKAVEQEAKATGKPFCRCRNPEERSLE